ncbi:mannose-6-phosphate isomerase [Poseidonocella sp. HB161398]|uniref:mannose-6-phosphate isomerase n=1 Tax=Poseidonocella sp. HB161398 TaxID=2320855 RepID=UPI001108B71A|nr:mannose-6-phosphate isomerase [Poseidonocella sp. HB161398]
MSNVKAVNLAEKLVPFSEARELGEFNGCALHRVVLPAGACCETRTGAVDFFHVIKGSLEIELAEELVELGRGEMYVVPAGTSCRAAALEETEVLLIDRAAGPARLH